MFHKHLPHSVFSTHSFKRNQAEQSWVLEVSPPLCHPLSLLQSKSAAANADQLPCLLCYLLPIAARIFYLQNKFNLVVSYVKMLYSSLCPPFLLHSATNSILSELPFSHSKFFHVLWRYSALYVCCMGGTHKWYVCGMCGICVCVLDFSCLFLHPRLALPFFLSEEFLFVRVSSFTSPAKTFPCFPYISCFHSHLYLLSPFMYFCFVVYSISRVISLFCKLCLRVYMNDR